MLHRFIKALGRWFLRRLRFGIFIERQLEPQQEILGNALVARLRMFLDAWGSWISGIRTYYHEWTGHPRFTRLRKTLPILLRGLLAGGKMLPDEPKHDPILPRVQPTNSPSWCRVSVSR